MLVTVLCLLSSTGWSHTGVSVEHADTAKDYLADEDHRHRPLGFDAQQTLVLSEDTRRSEVAVFGFYDRDFTNGDNSVANAFAVDNGLFSTRPTLIPYDAGNPFGLPSPSSFQQSVQLRLDDYLDYETATSHTVTITGRDEYDDPQWNAENTEGLWEVATTIYVEVVDVDEETNRLPYFLFGPTSVSFDESVPGGTEIESTSYAAFDDDTADTVTLSISGPDAALFVFNEFDRLSTADGAVFDYETKDTYQITVTASDGRGGTVTLSVTIRVWDVDEEVEAVNSPPTWGATSLTRGVVENYVGHFGPAVQAQDADSGDLVQYALTGGASASLFTIHNATGVLSTVSALDYESASSHTLEVTASDNAGATATVAVTVQVFDDTGDNSATPPPPVVTTQPPSTNRGGGSSGGGGGGGGGSSKRSPPPEVEPEEDTPPDATLDDDIELIAPVGPQFVLENPSPDSQHSGIGIISGWSCDAESLAVIIDGQEMVPAYRTERLDTETVCGDVNNGFGLLFNWNILGDGLHTIVLVLDGQEVAESSFTVTTLGEEFVRDVSDASCVVADWPSTGEDVTLQWQQNSQNFVITDVE